MHILGRSHPQLAQIATPGTALLPTKFSKQVELLALFSVGQGAEASFELRQVR